MRNGLVRVGAVLTGLLAYNTLLRPRLLRWGVTKEEALEPLPGDELIPDPVRGVNTTHAIVIDAPPSAVWPWIVQMGYRRGGWYSHDCVERMMLAGRYTEGHSATWIHPELQGLEVGDHVYYGPGMKVEVMAIEPEKYLVLKGHAFVLEDLGDGRTRLIVRTRGHGYLRAALVRIPVLRHLGMITDYVVGEPLHHYMEKGMLLGIARRAEQTQGEALPKVSATV